MRIAFIGAVDFSHRMLKHLLSSGATVVAVCTLERSPVNADHVDLRPLCEQWGVPWRYTSDVNSLETLQWLAERQPDVIFCFGWSRLLKRPLLELAPIGVVGFHPTALPANRGRHPLIWALALGLTETASTFFFMDEGADSGDIISQAPLTIAPDDSAGSLYGRMVATATAQLDEFVPLLESADYPRRVQDHTRANYWRKRSKADGAIDWRMAADSIHNLVRALAKPYPGADFVHKGQEIKVWNSAVVPAPADHNEPGKVLSVVDGVLVKCGHDAILLRETEPPISPELGAYL